MGQLRIRPGSGINIAWDHVITSGADTDKSTWANDHTQSVLILDFHWTDFLEGNVQREVLGYPTVIGPVGNRTLSRKIPMPHPWFGFRMWATKIVEAQGFKFLGQTAAGRSNYQRARCTVLFEPLPYRVLTDGLLANVFQGREWERYTSVKQETTLEFLSRKGNHFKWAQGDNAGQEIQFDFPHRLAKQQYTLIWHDIPARALYGDNLRSRPDKQANGAGRVNNDVFFGWPAETLLCMPPRMVEKKAPYRSDRQNDLNPELLYDVHFHLLAFDPPVVVDEAVARGHNVVPQAQRAAWALVTSTGNIAGARIYHNYDFALLFGING